MSLEKGSDGIAVVNLQKNLRQLGIVPLDIDGTFGPQTFSAVETFQSAHSLPITGVVDALTQANIIKALCSQVTDPPDLGVPWLTWMRAHIGELEETGSPATDFDDEVFHHTSYGLLDGVMEPGCAATACAALEETLFKSPHSAAAESFRNFGIACPLKPGAIVGFNWKGQKGVHCDHVTFCDHIIDASHVACLGGNQGHHVKVSIFSIANIDFIRWPVEKIEDSSEKTNDDTSNKKENP